MSPWPRHRLGPQAGGPAPFNVLQCATSTLPLSKGQRSLGVSSRNWASLPRLPGPEASGEARVRGMTLSSYDTFSQMSRDE